MLSDSCGTHSEVHALAFTDSSVALLGVLLHWVSGSYKQQDHIGNMQLHVIRQVCHLAQWDLAFHLLSHS